ncbi:hypothetical protein BJ878DRAFT_523448 [Calycina marina]|uniref:Uncharacterized protein n=1 Tax=Calycina marina TaxID=1763456 RepID=A0A9P7YVT8_9HELO|nr:hypothetical protein BJ878DRAFT_523448 [Calycina marina]
MYTHFFRHLNILSKYSCHGSTIQRFLDSRHPPSILLRLGYRLWTCYRCSFIEEVRTLSGLSPHSTSWCSRRAWRRLFNLHGFSLYSTLFRRLGLFSCDSYSPFTPAFPYVFKGVYGFTIEQSGTVFLAIGFGFLLAIPTVDLCDKLVFQP